MEQILNFWCVMTILTVSLDLTARGDDAEPVAKQD